MNREKNQASISALFGVKSIEKDSKIVKEKNYEKVEEILCKN